MPVVDIALIGLAVVGIIIDHKRSKSRAASVIGGLMVAGAACLSAFMLVVLAQILAGLLNV
jgi:hypothetical protein